MDSKEQQIELEIALGIVAAASGNCSKAVAAAAVAG